MKVLLKKEQGPLLLFSTSEPCALPFAHPSLKRREFAVKSALVSTSGQLNDSHFKHVVNDFYSFIFSSYESEDYYDSIKSILIVLKYKK